MRDDEWEHIFDPDMYDYFWHPVDAECIHCDGSGVLSQDANAQLRMFYENLECGDT